ncbi:MAG TPA: NAD(P)H-dependent oxidoreductase [Tahibacter sp.]|uniref:FMN-dependent NADH-azoreductase n=1 Tax=Tahibacter sp. TaxID=2056211 RepID=UPI002C893413|nr:NAD(P)H-dependent oxidoreductase [Tahibacter sp.]HSX60216.1 NAD(P)H-dependent oxidoreductase [Tahibacter sp.]
MKLLQLDSSPLGTHSVTRELTAAVVAQYRREHPEIEVTYRDLAADPLPHWTPLPRDAVDALAPERRAEVERNETALQEFLDADVLVVGAPMYNFGVPSQLKAWIDRIAVAGRTFRYTAQGPEGLAVGKRVIVLSGRGGFYADTALQAADFQESYLRQLFGFLGIRDIRFIRAEGVGISAEQRAASMAAAHERIGSEALARAA